MRIHAASSRPTRFYTHKILSSGIEKGEISHRDGQILYMCPDSSKHWITDTGPVI